MDAARDTERNIELTLAYWELGRASGVVKGVWRHGVVVGVIRPVSIVSKEPHKSKRVDLRSNVEEHAVCFSVAEALALAISLAKRAAGIERVLRAARLKVVRWCGLNIGNDSAAWSACRRAAGGLALCRICKFEAQRLTGTGLRRESKIPRWTRAAQD